MRWIGGFAFVCALTATGTALSAQPADLAADAEALAQTCVPAGQQDRLMTDFSKAERLALISCAQREVARQLNAQLPRQMDELTMLHVITTEGPRLTYHFKLSLDAEDISSEQRATMIQLTRANVCREADMRQTISLGGSYSYVWIDPDNVEIARTSIEHC